MDNRFSTSSLAPTWATATEILKGDLPGHPFRGNQHVDASFSSTNSIVGGAKTIGEASQKLNEHTQNGEFSLSYQGGEMTGHGYDSPDVEGTFYHPEVEAAHEEIARALDKVGTPEAQSAAVAHRDAAEGHREAEGAAEEAVPGSSEGDDHYREVAEEAQKLTDDANKITMGR
jgi:hypothetical protein